MQPPSCPVPATAFNPQTAEDALHLDQRSSRLQSQKLSHRAVRDFKRAHPELDLATIHPSYVYGPLGSGQIYGARGAGTNWFVYAPLAGAPGDGAPLDRVRFRDPPPAAEHRRAGRRARARARFGLPPVPKQFTVSSSTFTWNEAVELTAQAKPEQKGRLPVVTGRGPVLVPFATLDTGAIETALGLKDY